MKLTLFDKDNKVIMVVPRVHDLLHHSNGDLDVAFEDWSLLTITRNEYYFYTMEENL